MDPASLTSEQARAHHNAHARLCAGWRRSAGRGQGPLCLAPGAPGRTGQKFSENALDATDAFALYVTTEELAGVPDDVVQSTAAAAQAEGKTGHKLTLKMPCYLPVMQFAHSSPLREKLYRAYATRASDQAEGDAVKFDNAAIMGELLALRHEEAQLLGYRHYADVSLVARWRSRPSRWSTSCANWPRKARPHAEEDLADLRAFAAGNFGLSRTRQSLGLALHRREAQGGPIRVQRAGSQTLFHGAEGARRSVPDRRDAV